MQKLGSTYLSELCARSNAEQDRIALLSSDGKITYRELFEQISFVSESITTARLGQQDVVALALPNNAEFLAVCLGITGSAICAPLNPILTEVELRTLLTSLDARALVTETLDSTPARIARTLGVRVVLSSSLFLTQRSTRVPAAAADGIALILQTSATTGRAKLVPITHETLHAMAANTVQILGLRADDQLLSMMPFFHLQGLLSSLAQLLAGGTVICTPGFDAQCFSSWLHDLRPSWYTAGPALHSAILSAIANQSDRQPSSLRFVRSIGAPLPFDLRNAVERELQVPVLEGYGMTETGMVTSNPLSESIRASASVGQPAGVQVGILNSVGEIAPPQYEGQIVVRGPAVVKGYFNDPIATQEAFRDGWFHTGDLGYLDDSGYLFVTGRIKDIINRGGEKVSPLEVESSLAAHPSVHEVTAFALPHPTLGEDVAAAVVLRPGETATESELRRFTATRLALFKVPRRIFIVDTIPKGPTGKSNRDALRQVVAIPVATPEETFSAIEERIARIWKQVLDLDRVSTTDDFFSIGGDSFAATLMLADVEQEFGLSKAPWEESDFFLSSDLATLGRIVNAAGCSASSQTTRSPFLALQPNGSRLPFFCFPGADENPYYLRALAHRLGNDQPFFIVRDPRLLETRGVYSVEEAAERFTHLLCKFQPNAPFLLGGHCYGGILSFEIARQLQALGRGVALLVLFEAPTPGYPKVLRHWKGYARQGVSMVRKRRLIGFDEAAAHVTVLKGLIGSRLKGLKRRVLLDAGLKQVIAPLGTSEHPNVQAGRSYQPKCLACDIVQFMAADEAHSFEVLDDPRLGWREFTRGAFMTRRTPGIAAGIFKEPHVSALAAQLNQLLDGLNLPSSTQAPLLRESASLSRS